jgi:hypothetical protein
MAGYFQKDIAGVPPSMRNSGWKECGPTSCDNYLLTCDADAEQSRFNATFLKLMEMHVNGRSAHFGRQGTFDGQDDLTLAITHSAHQQNLAGVAILQPQETIHKPSSQFGAGR